MFIDWEKHTDYWLPSILEGHDAPCPPALIVQTKQELKRVCFNFPKFPCREHQSPSRCSIVLWSKSPTETRYDQIYNPFFLWRLLSSRQDRAAVTAASLLILQSLQRTMRIIVHLYLPYSLVATVGLFCPPRRESACLTLSPFPEMFSVSY